MLGCISYLIIALRWVQNISAWESLYIFPVGLSFGLILSAQFVWLSANAPKSQTAMAVSSYYLCQQVGTVLGVGTSTLLIQKDFYRRLLEALGDISHKKQVTFTSLGWV